MITPVQRIYLDNAATTSLDPQVLEAMMPFLTEQYGNPSSIYSYGREARMAIEKARKYIATTFNATPSEIFFTSCGTESSNTAIQGALRDLGCKRIISSAIEHHATLYTVQHLANVNACELSFVKLTEDGHIDYVDLENLLSTYQHEKCLVSLMHANNEIGNLLDLERVSELCKKYQAIFHTDTVQTVGHYTFDLAKTHVHFLSASAHKFHGPKGSGLLYVNKEINIKPYLTGGSQERNMRAGTENTANIVGFAKALELALSNLAHEKMHIQSLKNHLKTRLKAEIPHIIFHGDCHEKSLFTVLNTGFPMNEKTEMLSMNLDIAGICVSGGSACSSGAQGGSHVIKGVYPNSNVIPIRFSFSKHNTNKEIEKTVEVIKTLLQES
jgi:cysteine desulfurase